MVEPGINVRAGRSSEGRYRALQCPLATNERPNTVRRSADVVLSRINKELLALDDWIFRRRDVPGNSTDGNNNADDQAMQWVDARSPSY